MVSIRAVIAAAIVLVLVTPVLAVEPGEILPDPILEARARAISSGLRCLVCQNQSIDDSNAPLAKDLRVLVRERLVAGESDPAVVDYIVARYGDFVLLKPPINARTLLLWLAPVLSLAGLAYGLLRAMGRFGPSPAAKPETPLSRDEEEKLRRILQNRP